MNENVKINLVINSKKLRNLNQNANNITLNIEDGLIRCDPKTQYIELNIVSWIMKNDFYNTQSANNKFQITFKDANNIITSSIIKIIEPGNYNVIQMQSTLNDALSDICSIEYLSILNKYKYRKTNTNSKVFITSISANDFLGFENGIEYEILELGLISKNVLNMAGDSIIILEIPNISTNPRILDNILTGNVVPSSTMAYIVIDIPSYGLLKYENADSGDSFSYVLTNTDIKSLNLVVKNQDKEIIEISDYDLTLQFIIHNKNSSTQLTVLRNIDKSLNKIVQMVGDLWQKYTKK